MFKTSYQGFNDKNFKFFNNWLSILITQLEMNSKLSLNH